MNELQEQVPTPGERAAIEVLGALPSPRPDAAYRQRVARAFVAGSLKSTVRQRPFFARAELWAALGAAAALVVVTFALNRGPDWRVVEVRGAGEVVVDGKPLALRGAELARAIRGGAHVTLPETASLDIVAPGMLAMSVEGGSDLVLPAVPNRWWSRTAHGHVTLGNVFLSTGRAFRGAELELETAEAVAHVTGTSLAVLRDREAGTCVCVLEGQVVVSYEDGKESVPVPAGKRCVCPPGGEAEVRPILEYSEHELHRLNERSAAALGR